jgi:hypothetical protein
MKAALKEHIEAIVNRVRAFDGRKARYREELLAYLMDLVDACDGDEQEAIRRFGNPRDIGRELQQSVPLLERVAAIQIAPDPPINKWTSYLPASNEPALRYGVRTAVFVLVAQLVLCLATVAICVGIQHGTLTNTLYLGRPLKFLVPFCAGSFLVVAPLMAFGAKPGRGGVLAFRAAALTLWILAVMAGLFCLEHGLGVMSLSPRQFGNLAAPAILAPWGVLLTFALANRERSRFKRWQEI